MTPPLTRQEINRRAAAVRLAVLRRLRAEQPETFAAWWADAYRALDERRADATDQT